MEKIIQEMRRLEGLIEYHSKKYHDEDSPEISDYEYDRLFERLKTLEKEYPRFASPNSPTFRVGGHVAEKFEKVSHPVRLGSLTDVFDYEGVADFYRRVKTQFPDADFVVECKIDGLSVALEYIDGIFVRGATRGNGLVGEDVTRNLKTIRSVPLVINQKLPRLIVRGEVYMPKKNLRPIKRKAGGGGACPLCQSEKRGGGVAASAGFKAVRRKEAGNFRFQYSALRYTCSSYPRGMP